MQNNCSNRPEEFIQSPCKDEGSCYNESICHNESSCKTENLEYAGFWVRLAAYVLDSIVVFCALLVVRLAMAGLMAVVKDTVLGGNILFQYNLKDIVLYAAEALYFILCTYYTGTTLGKRAMNLRVICADGEQRIGLLTVVYRETVGRFLSSVIMGVGYLMIGIDKEKRGIHDILCDTRVVYGKKIKVFKMETTFKPLAEPMGRVPEYKLVLPNGSGSVQEVPKQMPQSGTAPEEDGQRPSAGSPQMPWDAPYTGQDNTQKPEERERDS